MSTPPDLSTVVSTLESATQLLGKRVELSRQVADLQVKLSAVLSQLETLLSQLNAVDDQIKAANIDQTVTTLKAFQQALGG